MGSDRARRSYDVTRKYRSVVAQQGRVTLEADLNEGEEIRAEESRNQLLDIIGPSGAKGTGFKISVPSKSPVPFDFVIGRGSLYVGGVRVQTGRTRFLSQERREWIERPGPREQMPKQKAPFREAVFLTVDEQEISAVEDRALREVALGGPDTSARVRMIQRVRRSIVDAEGCQSAFEAVLKKEYATGRAFDPDTMRLQSAMKLQVDFDREPSQADECQPTQQSGFLGPENQLIRVQVSRGGQMLWGWDNASSVYRVKVTDRSTLELEGVPADVFHRPHPNQWVEILETAVNLGSGEYVATAIGRTRQVVSYDPARRVLTLKGQLPAGFNPRQAFVRIWDNRQAFPAAGSSVELVDFRGTGTGLVIKTNGEPPVPGDYWMIGVRPRTPHEILPKRLHDSLQPPDGPNRWIVPLAVISWHGKGGATVTDCRRHICDIRCRDADLEFHNKHLHGWGVVCGLQVNCMTPELAKERGLDRPRESVIVRDGYALHPTGKDIRVRSIDGNGMTAVKLGDLAVAENALKRDGNGQLEDGAVSLWIDQHRVFHADAYQPAKSPWSGLLEGTLLLDIYQDCVLMVVEYLRAQVTSPAGARPVTVEARRLIAVINLYWQLVNQTNGKHIYLSEKEHDLLEELFEGLKELLQSKTFCAMFDDVKYPDYDVYRADATANMPRPTTIFGTSRHTRIRVHPRFPLAFTCGIGKDINVYDLERGELAGQVEFPGVTPAVQDVAFGRGAQGEEIYAIAWTGASQTDSDFLVGTLNRNGDVNWTARKVGRAGLKLVSLATGDDPSGRVFAAARGEGIFSIDPAPSPPDLDPLWKCHATGHLATGKVRDHVFVYAGQHTTDPNPVAFDRLVGIEVSSRTPCYFELPEKGAEGHDDLAIVREPKGDHLYAIIDGAGSTDTRRLVVWDIRELVPAPGAPNVRVVELGRSAGNRIAYAGGPAKWAMITYFDSYIGRAYVPGALDLDHEIHPLQILPSSIAATARGDHFYALEAISNTITQIPTHAYQAARTRSTVDMVKLVAYRREAIIAFVRVAGRLVQFLKDCVCEHLLVNCPTNQGKVYLAEVSFKDGKVYQICNFHHRKYVHTFPTVEYWMSLVPVLPLLKRLVEKFCCSVVANVFDRFIPAQDPKDDKLDVISMTMVANAATYLKAANVKAQVETRKSQLGLAAAFGRTALEKKLRRPSPGHVKPPASAVDVIANTPETANDTVVEKGIAVRRVEPAENDLSAVLAIALTPTVRTGDSVDLVTDSTGKVVGMRRAPRILLTEPVPPPAPTTPMLPEGPAIRPRRRVADEPSADDVATLRRELATLRKQMGDMQKTIKSLQREPPG